MPRPQQLHKEGIRRTITFRPDLDEKLAVIAAQRRIPISLVVEDLLDAAILGSKSSGSLALEFPAGWDGADLYSRLITLRMRQKDLAMVLGLNDRTLNHWVRGKYPYPKGMLERIKKALKKWDPDKQNNFRVGSRSPMA